MTNTLLHNSYQSKPDSLLKFEQKISHDDIVHFTRYLATLISAGVALATALDIIASTHEKPAMQKLLVNINSAIASGQNFSEVLQLYPHYFDQLYCGLIAAALQSGTLDSMLRRIADDMERTAALTKKIKKAMTYPGMILIVSILICALLLIFVVPEFATLFSAYGAKLPPFTRLVLTLSTGLQDNGWIIVILLSTVLFSFYYFSKHSPKFKYVLDHIRLKLWLMGKLKQKTVIAQSARTLSTTLAAGVPLIDTLTTVAYAAGNAVFKEAFLHIRTQVTLGENLHQALKSTQLFPPMVIQMVAIGEESGAIEAMLTKIANHYDEEVDHIITHLSTLIEPVIMLILGILIGSFILAMYLPIFKLGSIF